MNEYGYNTLAEAISNFEQQMPKLDRSFSSAVPAEDAATGGSKVQYDNLKQVSAKLTIRSHHSTLSIYIHPPKVALSTHSLTLFPLQDVCPSPLPPPPSPPLPRHPTHLTPPPSPPPSPPPPAPLLNHHPTPNHPNASSAPTPLQRPRPARRLSRPQRPSTDERCLPKGQHREAEETEFGGKEGREGSVIEWEERTLLHSRGR